MSLKCRELRAGGLSGGIFNQAEIVFGAVQSMPVAVNAARALGDERNRIKAAPASGYGKPVTDRRSLIRKERLISAI